MASDDIWILGIAMTKFGKHSDKDIVDLGSQAAIAALADAGVTMADIGILAAGNLMGLELVSGSNCRNKLVKLVFQCSTWLMPAQQGLLHYAQRLWRLRLERPAWDLLSGPRSFRVQVCSEAAEPPKERQQV